MRDGTWSARLALLKIHEEALGALTEQERQTLYNYVEKQGREATESTLRSFQPFVREILEMTPAKRRRHLSALPAGHSLLQRYANVAWSAKAVALFEYLERSSIGPTDPQKWAGPAGLRLVCDYEEWEDWLWPFEGPWPWPDNDDD